MMTAPKGLNDDGLKDLMMTPTANCDDLKV